MQSCGRPAFEAYIVSDLAQTPRARIARNAIIPIEKPVYLVAMPHGIYDRVLIVTHANIGKENTESKRLYTMDH